MDLTTGLAFLRAEAESRMRDTCRVTRAVSGTGDLDPDTGLPVANPRTVVYAGACRVRTGGSISAGSLRQSAADTVTQVTSVLSVPVSAPAVLVNDRVEITSSENPVLVRLFTVSGLIPNSQSTAQRVQITAVID